MDSLLNLKKKDLCSADILKKREKGLLGFHKGLKCGN